MLRKFGLFRYETLIVGERGIAHGGLGLRKWNRWYSVLVATLKPYPLFLAEPSRTRLDWKTIAWREYQTQRPWSLEVISRKQFSCRCKVCVLFLSFLELVNSANSFSIPLHNLLLYPR